MVNYAVKLRRKKKLLVWKPVHLIQTAWRHGKSLFSAICVGALKTKEKPKVNRKCTFIAHTNTGLSKCKWQCTPLLSKCSQMRCCSSYLTQNGQKHPQNAKNRSTQEGWTVIVDCLRHHFMQGDHFLSLSLLFSNFREEKGLTMYPRGMVLISNCFIVDSNTYPSKTPREIVAAGGWEIIVKI